VKATGLSIEDIRRAQPVVAEAAIRTPLVRLNVWEAPAEIYLKLENLQPIGSFKIRGAAYAMSQTSRAELAKGVLVASAGNMAQGAAWNARRLGIPCTVIAPDYAPQTKLDAIERLGGRVIKVPFDRWWQTFTDRSFPGIEILEDQPDIDTVLIPWGGGGLATGIATSLRALKPSLRIYAVEAETGAPLTAALKAGSPQTVDYQPSWVDGIGSKSVFANMLVMAQELLDGSFTASLDEIAAAVRLMAERNRVIAEGAGATALAVAMSGKAGSGRIACVVSGGNIDAAKLTKILSEH
jgi:threonine dehydratase